MKALNALTTLICLTMLTEPSLAKQKNVYVNASDVYISSTRNPNQETNVMLQGFFPNTCYEWHSGEVTHLTEVEHEVRGIAIVNQGPCLMVFVQFQEEISLGHLNDGPHLLRVRNGDGTYFEKEFTVR